MNDLGKLRVQTFGRFAVRRHDGSPIRTSDWGREKARILFEYLVTRGDDATHRERITFDLWPELDDHRAERDFKVVLNALVNALEPNRLPRSPSRYIRRINHTYGIHAEVMDIDAEQFRYHAQRGARLERVAPQDSIDAYRSAVDIYTGDYLPDARYEDWASATREYLSTLFLSSAAKLAQLLLKGGHHQEAIALASRVLAHDACWEEAYRILMHAHMQRGNRPQAVKTYEKCIATLDRELGLQPMAETRQLYDRIRQG